MIFGLHTLTSYLLYQYVGLQNLVQRNEQLYCSGDAPSGGVSLPFILVQVSFLLNISLVSLYAF